MNRTRRLLGILLAALALITGVLPVSGCVSAYRQSVGAIDTAQVVTRIYLTDFNTAWQAVLDSLKNSRLDISNREGGLVQTRWTDNTTEKNFADSFGGADSYLKAQYRVRVTVAKGFFNGKPSVKVSIQKEQLIQRDVLEGWRPVETDSIDEQTLLYRVGRIISIRMKMARLEEDKTQHDLRKTGLNSESGTSFDSVGDAPPPPSEEEPPPPPDDAALDAATQ